MFSFQEGPARLQRADGFGATNSLTAFFGATHRLYRTILLGSRLLDVIRIYVFVATPRARTLRARARKRDRAERLWFLIHHQQQRQRQRRRGRWGELGLVELDL